ncbi:MAG: hypothetical protein Q7V57_06270 [Actinomycetota bacterium]|nr:hypothetical protein [Actinomycetota bacterium]
MADASRRALGWQSPVAGLLDLCALEKGRFAIPIVDGLYFPRFVVSESGLSVLQIRNVPERIREWRQAGLAPHEIEKAINMICLADFMSLPPELSDEDVSLCEREIAAHVVSSWRLSAEQWLPRREVSVVSWVTDDGWHISLHRSISGEI